jgi:ribosome-binding protein aMBF1 (putative translation factor)
MSRGGSRPGAGRPRGSRNKETIARDALLAAAAAGDASTPKQRADRLLSVLEAVALGEAFEVSTRIAAAKAALPYWQPRLTENAHSLNVTEGLADRVRRARERSGMNVAPVATAVGANKSGTDQSGRSQSGGSQ